MTVTECCGVLLAADQRFCPKCGWEARASSTLHQQAEALAQQIAQRLNNHWADDRSVPDVIALILPTLQRVQAETLLNAAEHIARNGSTFYKPGRAEEYLREQAERIARDE